MPVSIFEPRFEAIPAPEGFRSSVDPIGSRAGAQRLSARLWELPPGQGLCPYHYELVEEMAVVIAGAPSVRTSEGTRKLSEGEVVCFPRGERGAHQLLNETDAPARVLMVSEAHEGEIGFYPDSAKVGVFPGRDADAPDWMPAIFRLGDRADYFDGESR